MQKKKFQPPANLKASIAKILGKEIDNSRDTVFQKYKIPIMNVKKTKGETI